MSIAVYIQNQICKLSVSLICADSVLVMYCGWESRGQSPLRVIQKGRAPLVLSAQDRPPRRSAACIRPADGTRPADSLESDRFDRREKLIQYGLRPYISAPFLSRLRLDEGNFQPTVAPINHFHHRMIPSFHPTLYHPEFPSP